MKTEKNKVLTKTDLSKILEKLPEDAKIAIRTSMLISGVRTTKYDEKENILFLEGFVRLFIEGLR